MNAPEVGSVVRWLDIEECVAAMLNRLAVLREQFPGTLMVESHVKAPEGCPDNTFITISHDGITIGDKVNAEEGGKKPMARWFSPEWVRVVPAST